MSEQKREVFGKQLEDCNRCKYYGGYRFHTVERYIDEKGETRCKYETVILCKSNECKPDLKPLTCNYCSIPLNELPEKADIEPDLKENLKKLGMCLNCYENWREECLCLLCYFDYPSSNIKGRKGNYCFCKGCEWYNQCPEKQKMFIDCTDMTEISEKKVEKILELL